MAELDLASLVVSVRADVRDAATGIDQLNSKLDTIGKTTDKVGQDTAKVQQEMTSGWLALNQQLQAMGELYNSIGKPLSNFFKSAINGASDLQETVSKTNVVFGDLADGVLEWSESATTTMGLSRNSALSMASAFGDLATSMGLARSQSQSMAMNLTQLAADLASFKNIDAQQAFTALQGIFTGNAQALKSLGVVMNETTLEAYALSQGITTSYQSMSESEKVALRYQFVLAQTANAQGDFARTSGGYANATRTLSESFSDLTASLGEMLLPMMETVIGAITDIVQFINDMPAGIKAIITALGMAGTAFTIIIPIIGKATAAFKALSTAFMASNPLGWVAGIAAAVAGIGTIISSFVSANRKAEEEAKEIKGKVDGIKEKLAEIDATHTATYEVDVKDNTQTVSQKLATVSENFTRTVSGIRASLAGIVAEYTAKNYTISAGIIATGLNTDSVDKNLDMNANLNSISDNIAEDEKKVDVEADATTFDDSQIKGQEIPVEALAAWKENYSPQEIAGKVNIPLVANDGNPLIVEAKEGQSFIELTNYIDEQLRTIDVNLQKGDISGALEAASEVDYLLTHLGLQVDTEEEKKLVQSFTDNVWTPLNTLLTTLHIDISNINDFVDYPSLHRKIQGNLTNMRDLYVSLSELKDKKTDGKTVWEAYKEAWNQAEHALEGEIALRKATGQDTTMAENLLDKVKGLKSQYNTEIKTVISEEDLSTLESYGAQISAIIGTNWTLWRDAAVPALQDIQKAIYYDATGKESSGNMIQDIIDLRTEIAKGFGEESLWSKYIENVKAAASQTTEWKDQVVAVQTALKNTLTEQILNKQVELQLRKLDTYESMYQAELAGDDAKFAALQKQADDLDAQIKALSESAEEIKNIDDEGYEGYRKTRNAGAAAGIDPTDGKELGTAQQQVALVLTEAADDMEVFIADVDKASAAVSKMVAELPKWKLPELNTKEYDKALKEYNRKVREWREEEQFSEVINSLAEDVAEAEKRLTRDYLEPEQRDEAYAAYTAAVDRYNKAIEWYEKNNPYKAEKEKLAEKENEMYVNAYKELFTQWSNYKPANEAEYQTGKAVENAIDGLRAAIIENPQNAAEYAGMIAELEKVQKQFDVAELSKIILANKADDDEALETLSSSAKGLLASMKEWLQSDGNLTNPETLGAITAIFADYLGQNLVSGAANNPLEEGGTVVNGNQTNISGGEYVNGNKFANQYYNYYVSNLPSNSPKTMEEVQEELDKQDENNASSLPGPG